MAFTIPTDVTTVMELDEYHAYVAKYVDPNDQDSIMASAGALKALGNNRKFLTEVINREMDNWESIRIEDSYRGEQTSVMLGEGEGYYVRANLWVPPKKVPLSRYWQREMFTYMNLHDHNFSFLTVGYHGPGYTTQIFEYDPDVLSDGQVGDKVHLDFLERTSLPQGKIMMYRACRDAHLQEHVTDFSISLNLMLNFSWLLKKQYFFDLKKSEVSRVFRGATSKTQIVLCEAARHIGNGRTVECLEKLAVGHSSTELRETAFRSMASLDAPGRPYIWRLALVDRDPTIRSIAEKELEGWNQPQSA